jgi:predicted negative regulator of RcsB-dependent stress response
MDSALRVALRVGTRARRASARASGRGVSSACRGGLLLLPLSHPLTLCGTALYSPAPLCVRRRRLSTNRPTQKELRAPDAFQRVGGVARRWLEQRRILALGAAILVVAAALVAGVVSSLTNRREQQAARGLGSALKPLDRPVGEPIPGDEEKPYGTQWDKDKASIAALTPFRAQYSGTLSAAMAALPLGDAELRLGQSENALPRFSDFLNRTPSKQILKVSALEGEGYAWEAKGQLEQALDAFDRMSKEDAGGFLAGMGLYHRARILSLQGKKAEAAQAFQEVVTAKPGTPAASLAQDRLGLLATEGIHPAAVGPTKPDAG